MRRSRSEAEATHPQAAPEGAPSESLLAKTRGMRNRPRGI